MFVPIPDTKDGAARNAGRPVLKFEID